MLTVWHHHIIKERTEEDTFIMLLIEAKIKDPSSKASQLSRSCFIQLCMDPIVYIWNTYIKTQIKVNIFINVFRNMHSSLINRL